MRHTALALLTFSLLFTGNAFSATSFGFDLPSFQSSSDSSDGESTEGSDEEDDDGFTAVPYGPPERITDTRYVREGETLFDWEHLRPYETPKKRRENANLGSFSLKVGVNALMGIDEDDGDLSGFETRLRLRYGPLGIEAGQQTLDDEGTNALYKERYHAKGTLEFDLYQFMVIRGGLGYVTWDDINDDSENAIIYGAEIELYPIRPLVLTASIDTFDTRQGKDFYDWSATIGITPSYFFTENPNLFVVIHAGYRRIWQRQGGPNSESLIFGLSLEF